MEEVDGARQHAAVSGMLKKSFTIIVIIIDPLHFGGHKMHAKPYQVQILIHMNVLFSMSGASVPAKKIENRLVMSRLVALPGATSITHPDIFYLRYIGVRLSPYYIAASAA